MFYVPEKCIFNCLNERCVPLEYRATRDVVQGNAKTGIISTRYLLKWSFFSLLCVECMSIVHNALFCQFFFIAAAAAAFYHVECSRVRCEPCIWVVVEWNTRTSIDIVRVYVHSSSCSSALFVYLFVLCSFAFLTFLHVSPFVSSGLLVLHASTRILRCTVL